MPRVQNGILLGAPGAIPSPSLVILYGQGSPASQAAASIDPAQDNIKSCAVGSLWIDMIGPGLWQKTAQPSSGAPNGSWSQLT
jgi:hypothetical protein